MNKKIGIITGVIIVIIILVVAVCIFTKSDSNKENSENETGSFSNTSFSINGYTIDIKSKEVGHPSEGTYFETSFELSSNNKSTYFVDFVDLKDIENSDKTYNSAKEEVTINDKTYNYFIEEDTWNATLYYQIPKEKIKIYPSGGVDKKTFFPKNQIECKKELELEENITYFGFVSRIEKNKGWDTLLNALNELNKGKSLKNTKVLFIGAGSEQKEFDNLVKKYHLEDIIIQKKFVLQKDLVNYYNAMDLFIFPTKRKSESLGLVGLEAMACKTFVIGCTLYGPREYLKNKKNSLTFLKENELKAKIKEFQKMPSKEKERIKENALLTVEKYNQELLQEKLTEIFY